MVVLLTARDEALDNLADLAELQRSPADLVAAQVRLCRQLGAGWSDIAEATELSKQAAWERWKDDPLPSNTTTQWDLKEGESVRRSTLHQRYGGNRQGGISSGRGSTEVLLFGEGGDQHGYDDGWQPDGLYHYTGEGQRRDQQLVRGNKTILTHAQSGKRLRVFRRASGTVTYVGEFRVDPERPYFTKTVPRTDSGTKRSVIVFRLRPVH
jgi:hypothetical protein